LTGTNSRAFALNNNAEVVGAFDTNDLGGGLHAFIYKTGSATDLNALVDPSAGWVLSYPSAINDKGSILLQGIRPGDLFHTLLLTQSSSSNSSPILTINIVGNSIVVSWPASFTGYRLFQSPNLLPSSWTLVSNPPVVTNGLNEVIFSPIPSGKLYFRLQSQSSSSSPILAINIIANSIVVSWPASVTGYHLIQSPNLLPSSWTTVTNTPVVTNGLNEVIFSPIPLDKRFFRLQSP
jgi:probable HAF family extracellular repeat protein